MSKAAFLRAREILRARIDEEQAEGARLPVFNENHQKIADSSEFTPVDNYTLDWALTAALEPHVGVTDGPSDTSPSGQILMGPRDEDWAEVAYWVFNSPSPDQLVKWFAGKPKDAEFPWATDFWPTQTELAAVGL